ncbi:ATP-binding protein [Lentilitoribacter sp. EG35]|uniref:ATP-binding protein n=1 Tax=Lentilitoribacter sp. EG35 TaxID=3234192 RepID=UPI003460E604
MENSRFDQILDGLNALVIIIDANRRIKFANKAAKKKFGDSVVGESFVRIVRQPDCLAAIDAVMNGEGERRVEITIGASPSATFEININSVGQGASNETRVALTFEDVSQIRDAQLMRSEFVANVSHELRSPLTALAGFIETLSGPAKDDAGARERFLGLMDKEAARMKRLIDDLLSLSKLQGKERIRPSGHVDVHLLVQRVIATLTPISEQEQKSIDFKNNSKITTILGDEDELIQIFHNIIENAIKYGALDTEVSIEISDLDHVAGLDGRVLAASVSDKGAGIAAEDIPRLTERFYRVDKSRSRIKGGTGLGLAIVKHILNRHRGRLQIESEVGAGSTFTIFLPIGEK